MLPSKRGYIFAKSLANPTVAMVLRPRKYLKLQNTKSEMPLN